MSPVIQVNIQDKVLEQNIYNIYKQSKNRKQNKARQHCETKAKESKERTRQNKRRKLWYTIERSDNYEGIR